MPESDVHVVRLDSIKESCELTIPSTCKTHLDSALDNGFQRPALPSLLVVIPGVKAVGSSVCPTASSSAMLDVKQLMCEVPTCSCGKKPAPLPSTWKGKGEYNGVFLLALPKSFTAAVVLQFCRQNGAATCLGRTR